MKFAIFSILFFALTSAHASDDCLLERLNFLPACRYVSEFSFGYEASDLNAKSPSSSTESINQSTNGMTLSQGFLINKRLYVGAWIEYESSVESGAKYGFSDFSRFRSEGFREPTFFSKYRLQEQSEEKGIIDLFLSASYGMDSREVMRDGSNRLNGRHLVNLGLSHGRIEDRWEFKSSLNILYSSSGKEINQKSKSTSDISSSIDYRFSFSAQYELKGQSFLYSVIGFEFRGKEKIDSSQNGNREIQSGSGTRFSFGGKKFLRSNLLVDLSYHYSKREFYIKSSPSFDGEESVQSVVGKLVLGFN
jgi:hypothetical protein